MKEQLIFVYDERNVEYLESMADFFKGDCKKNIAIFDKNKNTFLCSCEKIYISDDFITEHDVVKLISRLGGKDNLDIRFIKEIWDFYKEKKIKYQHYLEVKTAIENGTW